jgi:hypothetical protein
MEFFSTPKSVATFAGFSTLQLEEFVFAKVLSP